MEINTNQEPCFVTTTQGFSVSYKNKLLYSKYSPSRNIINHIQSINCLPGTVFLCLSPVLEYGLKELQEKLDPFSIIICIEKDKELHKFSLKYRNENREKFSFIKNNKVFFINENEALNLPIILNQKNYIFSNGQKLPNPGTLKRINRIDMSAGIQFHNSFYDELTNACINSIMTYWANRITLTKFGHRYSSNFFKNLKILSQTTPINNYINQITKPIFVFGAGESFIDGIKIIKNCPEKFFILCVDTALNSLLSYKIIPDGVFIEEAQFIISKAFLGTLKFNYQIFAGLSSLPQINHIVNKKRISYFTTMFSNEDFLNTKEINKILPTKNNPFGSVGLTAVYYATKFRQDKTIPIYICGLDFSYSAGLTHTKQTMAHIQRLIDNTKLKTVQNYYSCFNSNSIKIIDKQNNFMFTNHAMKNYSEMFISFFTTIENLFDVGKSGISLNLKSIDTTTILTNTIFENNTNTKVFSYSEDFEKEVINYFENEKKQLKYLRDILSGKIQLPENEINVEIKKIAESREYLYLHFPDGYLFNSSLSFLKRIRTEIDYFLKIFN